MTNKNLLKQFANKLRKQSAIYPAIDTETGKETGHISSVGVDSIENWAEFLSTNSKRLYDKVKGKDVYDMSNEEIDSIRSDAEQLTFIAKGLHQSTLDKAILGEPAEQEAEQSQQMWNEITDRKRQEKGLPPL